MVCTKAACQRERERERDRERERERERERDGGRERELTVMSQLSLCGSCLESELWCLSTV